MLLVFPTFDTSPIVDEKVFYLRSLSQEKFNKELARKVSAGWVVHEMSSSFRKTAFGGSTSYYAELRYGSDKKEG